MKAKDYTGRTGSRQGAPFKPFDRLGYTTIQPLMFLHGRPWDEIALGYCHALRPTHIRVVRGGVQLDAQHWRVTVYVRPGNKNPEANIIERIEQEVEVGLPEGIEGGGYALDAKILFHNDADYIPADHL